MARLAALAVFFCAAALVAETRAAGDLTTAEREELETFRALAARERARRAAPSAPSLSTQNGDVVIAVENGKKVGYKIGSGKVAYFNDLPEEMRALSGSSAATVAAALQVGYDLGSAKKEVSLTLASVMETMVKVDKKVDSSIGDFDKAIGTVNKVADTVDKAISNATTTFNGMSKKASEDAGKVTKSVEEKVAGLVTGACDKNKVGFVRYNAKTGDMEACGADSKWAKAAAKIELSGTKTNPAIDCKDIRAARGKPASGTYYVTIHGAHPKGVAAFCDMETLGGGWTLFSSKKDYNKPIIAAAPSKYNSACHNKRTANCENVIPVHAWQQTTEILFRFNTVDNTDTKNGNGPANTWTRHTTIPSNALYSRQGLHSADKSFKRYFFQGYSNGNHNPLVCGFDKRQAWNKDHFSTHGAQCVNGIHTGWGGQISESHSGSDQWLDIWNGQDGGSKYVKPDKTNGGKAQGSKCIAGRCSFADPILVMFR